MDNRNARDLTVQISGSLSAFTEPLASPMTQLAMNFEGICNTRTPTGPTRGTPRRKLSLGDVENDAATPIISSSMSRTLSSESGYCPSPDRCGSMSSMDSPSADFISSRRRSFSKVVRRPGFVRSISSPLTSRFEESETCAGEEHDENNNKENEFEFVKPTLPVYRSMSGKRTRPTSAPPELYTGRSSSKDSSDGDNISTRFSVDEDDDGFIDYTALEQTEDDTFMSSAVVGLMTAPLSNSTTQEPSQANMPPCGLFHPIQCDPNSINGRSRRSKSLSLKRPVPPRDPSPEERKKIRGRCSSAREASWNSPLLLGAVPVKSPLVRSQSVLESSTRFKDIEELLMQGTARSNLIGDLSKEHILPTIKGQHEDLMTIKPQTVTQVLNNEFGEIDDVYIVDCRYPYEYAGGHIKTALNFHVKEEVFDFFMKKPKCKSEKRTIIIFHCEFSSKRAPNMYRYLRNKDRDTHTQCYPKLFYPEMYVIQGGYKAFFESCLGYCEPQTYRPMAHENFTQELKRFSKRSKSWCEGQTMRKTYRQGLKF